MSAAAFRVGVDIGGTFTDTVLDDGQRLFSSKVLTTTAAPEQAIISGLREVIAQAGISPNAVSMVIHGTTLVTNALIERRSALTALITTEGFRDVIEMRRENRFEQYDLNLTLPLPLIARADRYTIGERIDSHGAVLKPIDEVELLALAESVVRKGYESVAIGLIHSYVNGTHEARVAEALRRLKPDISLSLSSEVSPQIREFERFNTVCANAYVRPMVANYLGRLSASLAGIGVVCPVFLMHSGGGLISVEDAARFPVRLLESGPAGGAIFAARFAAAYGLDRLVSYDMGGTTAKICLIEDGLPKTTDNFEVARTYRFKKGSGMPISIPVIEMVEIGAGGGSIGSVDPLRQIRVGPESAGSEPGPACYGRGGDRPTVTDANLMLGRLDPKRFAGGSIVLSVENAGIAVSTQVGDRLGLDTAAAAFGICEVVDENMANAARAHAVENGRDLSEFTMIAFGGAAPIHACRLCEKLGINDLLVPPGAGVGSAIGFLTAPFGYETVRSSHRRLGELDHEWLNDVLSRMKQDAAAFIARGGGDAQLNYRARAFMRYAGQGWEIPVDIVDMNFESDCSARLQSLFETAYERLFGRIIPRQPIEIVSWSMQAATPLLPVQKVARVPAQHPAPVVGARRIFDAAKRVFVEAQVIDRSAMTSGAFAVGPAVIVEDETSSFITSAFAAVMQNDGTLYVSRRPN
jgi:N-methylhydantoinase A